MNASLLVAGVLALAGGAAHSYLGERLILIPLFESADLPGTPFGGPRFTRSMIRFAWHFFAIVVWSTAALFLAISFGVFGGGDWTAVRVLAAAWAVFAVAVLVLSRGRHFAWLLGSFRHDHGVVGDGMRLPKSAHLSRPWRIREIARDFRLEDAWSLPVHGDAADFQTLLDTMTAFDPENSSSLPTRALFRLRFRLGRWFGWDDTGDEPPIPGTNERSLTHRLPVDLRGTAADLQFANLPFVPIYRTETEFAAEASNQTMHGVIHLAWVDQGEGRYQGQMAIYVKPRGAFGQAYMALIKPFRYLIVYPSLMRQIARAWTARIPVQPGRPRRHADVV